MALSTKIPLSVRSARFPVAIFTVNTSPKVSVSTPPITPVGSLPSGSESSPGTRPMAVTVSTPEIWESSVASSGLAPAKLNWLMGSTM